MPISLAASLSVAVTPGYISQLGEPKLHDEALIEASKFLFLQALSRGASLAVVSEGV